MKAFNKYNHSNGAVCVITEESLAKGVTTQMKALDECILMVQRFCRCRRGNWKTDNL